MSPDPVPALLPGRLAVPAGVAVELTEKAACRAVVVTALNAGVRAWWERLGFHPFEPHEPDQLDLYLLTSEIEATLKQ